MCRTRRSEAGTELPHRFVETRVARPDEEESRLFADITDYLRILFRKGKADKTNRAALIREILALQQSLSSSPRAAAQPLRARAERHPGEREKLLALAIRCDAAVSAKDNELLGIMAAHPQEPILIYAQRLETIAHVRELLRRVGRSAEAYTGALSRQEREALVDRFTRGKLDALIATDAGAEGLNLQERCSLLVNWDLPLNPTRVEQRIGRLHRIGQRRDVKVFNLVLKDSVDEYVLRLLFDKMALFTATVGEVDDVIADMAEGEDDMEERLVEIWLDTTTTAAIARIEALSDEVAESRERVTLASRMTAEVLG
jgi:SNF2 family DNA or RNA helicase